MPLLIEDAKKYSISIVAGSHRIGSGSEYSSIYNKIGIEEIGQNIGAAISPLILKDGTIHVFFKNSKSKWEPNLNLLNKKNMPVKINSSESGVVLTIVPCIDSLQPQLLGNLFQGNSDLHPNLIICPSLSPETKIFHTVSELLSLHNAVFAYVNSSEYGGSSFNIPHEWKEFLQGHPPVSDTISKFEEALLEIDVSPNNFFIKKHSVGNQFECTHSRYLPSSVPILVE